MGHDFFRVFDNFLDGSYHQVRILLHDPVITVLCQHMLPLRQARCPSKRVPYGDAPVPYAPDSRITTGLSEKLLNWPALGRAGQGGFQLARES